MALGTSRLLIRIALVAALLAALLLTTAWVFYADDRMPSHSARIGTFTIDLPEGSGSGTAFLINECGILTNFHVVFGPWYVKKFGRSCRIAVYASRLMMAGSRSSSELITLGLRSTGVGAGASGAGATMAGPSRVD